MELRQLIVLVIGTLGTVLVGFGVLSPEQNETIQSFLPELIGVIMQLIAILQSFNIIKSTKDEAEIAQLKAQGEIQALKIENMALKKG